MASPELCNQVHGFSAGGHDGFDGTPEPETG
jgi:hypothetical protein